MFCLSDTSFLSLSRFPSRLSLTFDNATFHSRTKHIAIRFHYIREAYNDGIIVLDHRGTDDMAADIFTKALDRIKLTKFARLVGLSQT